MLRISEIKLPLEHSEDALRSAVFDKLQISDDELINFSITDNRELFRKL